MTGNSVLLALVVATALGFVGGTAGTSTIFVVLAACSTGLYLASRRTAVTASNVNSQWSGSVAPAGPVAVGASA